MQQQSFGLASIITSFLFLLAVHIQSQTCEAQMMNDPSIVDERNCENDTTGNLSIIDMTGATFLGMQGGLYPGGTNQMPVSHQQIGIDLSDQFQPLDSSGNIDSINGKIVFASIGMSNAFRYSQHFFNEASASPLTNPDVFPLNLSIGGKDINAFLFGNYLTVMDTILSAGSRSNEEQIFKSQIQAIWFLQATHINNIDSTEGTDHILIMEDKFLQAFIILKQEFPNLKQIFCSGRDYGGYSAPSRGNPEPYAYYTSWAFKKLIDRQINGDPALNNASVPWLAWANHIWADGTKASSDGFFWECEDFVCDGVHPSIHGKIKVTDKLLTFFNNDPTTAWFRQTNPPSCTIGDPCDDNDPNTIDDEYDANCICSGNPIVNNCEPLSVFGVHHSFEIGLEPWTQRSSDDLDWTINSGATPTNATGPTEAKDGSFYMYLEADGGINQRAVLESQCFTLEDADATFLSLAVHMDGDDINRIGIAVQQEDSGSLHPLLTIIGEQGPDWMTHQIDLSEYVSEPIHLLIQGITGLGSTGDIAIDDIRINYCNPLEIVGNDISASGLIQASDHIIANSLINAANDMTFRAEQYVELIENFEVSSGAVFIAQIGACL